MMINTYTCFLSHTQLSYYYIELGRSIDKEHNWEGGVGSLQHGVQVYTEYQTEAAGRCGCEKGIAIVNRCHADIIS